MPVDPVCGIELDEDLALLHEHDGKKFYFCCNGCRLLFVKKPRKYKKMFRWEMPHTFYKILNFQLYVYNRDKHFLYGYQQEVQIVF